MTDRTNAESESYKRPQYVEARYPQLYGSYPTFFAAPLAETDESLRGADLAFLGVPWRAPTALNDFLRGGKRGNFEGTYLTPSTFRLNSLRFTGYLPELDVDVFDHFTVVDRGDVDATQNPVQMLDVVEQEVGSIVAADCIPIVMGGNAGPSTFPVLKAISDRASGVTTILNLDAHGDNASGDPKDDDPRVPRWTSTWALRILDLPRIDPARYYHFGLRGPVNDRETIKRFLNKGVLRKNIITYGELKTNRNARDEAWLSRLAEAVADGASKIWIAIDPDVLTVGASPDFDEAEPLGPTIEETIELLYQVGRVAGRERLGGVAIMATPPDAMALHRVLLYMLLHLLAGTVHHVNGALDNSESSVSPHIAPV